MQIHAVITQKVMKAFRVSHTGLILKSFFFFLPRKQIKRRNIPQIERECYLFSLLDL